MTDKAIDNAMDRAIEKAMDNTTGQQKTDSPTQSLRPARNAAARMQELMAGSPPSPPQAPSNEGSIIPSIEGRFIPSIDGTHDASIDVATTAPASAAVVASKAAAHHQAIIPSNDGTFIPSSKRGIKGARPSSKEGAKLGAVEAAGGSRQETPEQTVNEVLQAEVRAHVLAQLMPQESRGAATRLNVEMPEALHLSLKQHCVRTRTPIKALINALIAFYLDHQDEPASGV